METKTFCEEPDDNELEASREQIKIAEAWYRGILHAAPDGMLVVDELGKIALANAELARMFGYSEDELIGQPMELLVPEDLRQAHAGRRTAAAGSMREGQVRALSGNLRARRKDGSEFAVDVALSRLPQAVSHVGTICAAVRDITERKRMEAALAASEAQHRENSSLLKAVLESSSDLIVFALDKDYRYLAFNEQHREAIRAIWGRDIAPGMSMFDLLGEHPDHEKARLGFDRALAGESFVTEEAYGDEAHARLFWRIHCSPIRDEAGYILGLTCLSIDITERKRFEEKLAQRERNFRSLAENVPDNIARWDTEGRYLYINPTHERTLGKLYADVTGTPILDSHDSVNAAIARIVATGQPQVVRQRTIVDGNAELHDVSMVPEFDEAGRIVSVLGVGRNMTDVYRLQDTLAAREREFRSLVENLPVPMIRYDRQCRRIYVNPYIEHLSGLPMEALLSKTPTEGQMLAPAEARRLQDSVQHVLDSGSKDFVKLRFVAADGRESWYRMINVPEFGPDGSVQCVLSIGYDETERHLLETEFRRRAALEEQVSSIAQAVPGFLFLGRVEPDGRAHFPFVGEGVTELFGLRPEEIRDDAEVLRARYHPEDRVRLRECMEEAARMLMAYSCEIRIEHPVKGQRWIEIRSTPRRQADGAIVWHGLMFDITERKRIEAALAQREHDFRTLIENSPDTVARYGRDLRRLYVNPVFAALVEGGEQALIGKTPSECPGGPNGAIYEKNLVEVYVSEKEREFELIWTDKNGRECCSLIRLTPEFGKDGTVERILAIGRCITELYASRQKIHQMAFYDSLTSLPNRALFNDRLRQMIADASWHGQRTGVMLIDMDRFKKVNDTMGHAVGDELLCETAARLTNCVRAYDTVARLGGDEFAILLPEIRHGDDLGRIASKILGKFDEHFLLDGKEVFVSCSIGIAVYPDDSTEPHDLMRYADSAMYFAKRSGRNNFRFYSKDLTASARERLTLESELRHAIVRGQLELYYQPKVLLENETMIGSEALLRWHHPQLGMVPPGQFIQIAEDTGLIVDIGKWVLREACRTASEWNADGGPLHKVAVNLSARQFQTGDLAATVAALLEETACRPEWIELEITESLLLDEDGKTLEVLTGLRAMGIAIAIDDFGTGYSALSYLARFPIDTLKIDRSFIHSVTTEKYRAELVKAILSIARCLGQEVVAEGVETIEQAEFLKTHGCKVAQGYLYSKPLPKAEIASLPRQFSSAS